MCVNDIKASLFQSKSKQLTLFLHQIHVVCPNIILKYSKSTILEYGVCENPSLQSMCV